jgi:hypothetical protein
MTKVSVVTTFNQQGLKKYGQNMVHSFENFWPVEVDLWVYAEDCEPKSARDNTYIKDIAVVEDLNHFKSKWKDVPKANGVCPPEIKSKRPKDWHKQFKWDAVRFSHKVYSIFHCAKNCGADILFWMDGDTYCHSPITLEQILDLLPQQHDLYYVGRERKWPECGLYALDLKSPKTQEFLAEFQRVYDDAENGIFTMEEWHDSYVFEQVRQSIKGLKSFNWTEGLIKGEGHPVINSEWGAYIDHLKGNRKDLGKSKTTDLLQPRTEEYWNAK